MPSRGEQTNNNDDEDSYDEFAHAFDDLGGDEVEESLVRLEESFNSSQFYRAQTAAGAALKRPRGDTDANGRAENGSIYASTSRRPAPNPGLDDFRVSHQGQVQGGSVLPAGEDEFEEDGGLWRNMDLDRIETEAIQSSQRSQGHATVATRSRVNSNLPLHDPVARSSAKRGSKRARHDDQSDTTTTTTTHIESRNGQLNGEINADWKRIEELERQLAVKDEELLRFKKENQSKLGEVSLLRANMNRTIADFSGVLREKEEAIAKQKALNNEMKKMHEEQLARSETINAFKHTELATAAHWSSVTASVARRRGGPGITSSQRGYSQSQSQSVAAAVGLTTPTRRNRGSTRNLGSGEGGSGRSGTKRTSGEDSPSSRRSLLRQQRQQGMDSVKAKAKTLTFPGFVNSFAKPAITPRPGSKMNRDSTVQQNDREMEPEDDDAAVFQDDDIISRLEVEPMHLDQACGPSSSVVIEADKLPKKGEQRGWANPQYRFLWAVTTYSKQLNFISSLILSHSSPPCSDDDSSAHALSHSSTLYRLLNASLPAQTPIPLQEEYVVLTHMLLNLLSQGTTTDAEGRFAYLLDKFEYERQEDLTDDDRQREDEEEFWECQIVMDEAISEVLDGIASILGCMMVISLRSGMSQRIYDVFVLMRSICIHEPSMIHAILCFDSSLYKIMDLEVAPINSQSSRLSRLQPMYMNVINVVIICIQELAGKKERKEANEDEDEEWRLEGIAGERLIKASLGIVDTIAYQVHSNDQYSSLLTRKLERIIDETGLLASLLDHHRQSVSTMRHTLSILVRLSQYPSLWRNVIACKIDKSLEVPRRMNSLISKSETPLLEILARLLVDGRTRMGAKEAHAIHCDVINLLSQLVIQHSDALILVSESNSILAAIIKCLQIDTGLIWNDEGEEIGMQADVSVVDIMEQICMDVRLLSRLYILPKRPTNLGKKIQSHEIHLVLNGIKHCFTLAISRVAFAPEPDWFDSKSNQLLATVNEIGSDLLELVLSPEEMESAWQMLNDDEDEEENQPQVEQLDVESQTQMDVDDNEVIVLS